MSILPPLQKEEKQITFFKNGDQFGFFLVSSCPEECRCSSAPRDPKTTATHGSACLSCAQQARTTRDPKEAALKPGAARGVSCDAVDIPGVHQYPTPCLHVQQGCDRGEAISPLKHCEVCRGTGNLSEARRAGASKRQGSTASSPGITYLGTKLSHNRGMRLLSLKESL